MTADGGTSCVTYGVPHGPRRPDTCELQKSLIISIGNNEISPAVISHSRRLVPRAPSGRARILGRGALVSRARRSTKCCAPDPGHATASDAFVALFTFQTAHLVPAAHVCARGLHRCFTHPESRGGRSAEKRSGARRNTRGAYHDAIRQALARRLASRSASRRA